MTLLNGLKGDRCRTQAYAGAGCQEAEGGRQASRRGLELPEVTKQLEVSEQTYFRWRNQFGGMKAEDVKRLKELEAENARLKRIVADQALDIQGLKELSRGNF